MSAGPEQLCVGLAVGSGREAAFAAQEPISLFTIPWARVMRPELDQTPVSLLLSPTQTAGKQHLQGSNHRWPEALDHEFSVVHLPWSEIKLGMDPKNLFAPCFGGWHAWGALQLSGNESVRVGVPWLGWGGQGPGWSARITPPRGNEFPTAAP